METLTEPSPRQARPNLNWFDMRHAVGIGHAIEHTECAGGTLAQLLWQGRKLPFNNLPEFPLDTPGVIFCRRCGTRAGRKITRLLKWNERAEEVRRAKTSRLVARSSKERRKDEDGNLKYVVLRHWRWEKSVEEQLALITEKYTGMFSSVISPQPSLKALRPKPLSEILVADHDYLSEETLEGLDGVYPPSDVADTSYAPLRPDMIPKVDGSFPKAKYTSDMLSLPDKFILAKKISNRLGAPWIYVALDGENWATPSVLHLQAALRGLAPETIGDLHSQIAKISRGKPFVLCITLEGAENHVF